MKCVMHSPILFSSSNEKEMRNLREIAGSMEGKYKFLFPVMSVKSMRLTV